MSDLDRVFGPSDPVGAKIATDWIIELLKAVGAGRQGDHGKWQCPAHGCGPDHSAALAVDRGSRGALIYCHADARCTEDQILASLALRREHLFIPPRCRPMVHARAYLADLTFAPLKKGGGTPAQRGYRHEAYHYYGPDHRLERLRHPSGDKDILWESRDARGAWIPRLRPDVHARDLPLYRESELAPAIGAGEPIVVCESESSVDALVRAGIYATTWAGGAASPSERLATVLGAANVVIVPDHDPGGLACRDRLRELLPAARVLLGEPEEDARDLLARVGARAFTELIGAPQGPAEPAGPPNGGTHSTRTPPRCPCCSDVATLAAQGRWYCHPCRAYSPEWAYGGGEVLIYAHREHLRTRKPTDGEAAS